MRSFWHILYVDAMGGKQTKTDEAAHAKAADAAAEAIAGHRVELNCSSRSVVRARPVAGVDWGLRGSYAATILVILLSKIGN